MSVPPNRVSAELPRARHRLDIAATRGIPIPGHFTERASLLHHEPIKRARRSSVLPAQATATAGITWEPLMRHIALTALGRMQLRVAQRNARRSGRQRSCILRATNIWA